MLCSLFNLTFGKPHQFQFFGPSDARAGHAIPERPYYKLKSTPNSPFLHLSPYHRDFFKPPRPIALETADYRLSCELRGHENDVRGICICGDSGFATSSTDKTVRFWAPESNKKHWYVLSKTLAGHSSFVGPLAWIPPGDRFPEGGIVSGGMDTQVLLWDLSKGELVETMKGHQF